MRRQAASARCEKSRGNRTPAGCGFSALQAGGRVVYCRKSRLRPATHAGTGSSDEAHLPTTSQAAKTQVGISSSHVHQGGPASNCSPAAQRAAEIGRGVGRGRKATSAPAPAPCYAVSVGQGQRLQIPTLHLARNPRTGQPHPLLGRRRPTGGQGSTAQSCAEAHACGAGCVGAQARAGVVDRYLVPPQRFDGVMARACQPTGGCPAPRKCPPPANARFQC